jgi:hypothetical protein
MRLLNTCIISNEHTGDSVKDSYGLSIYLPDTSGAYDINYNSLLFALNTNWDEYLKYKP